MAVTTHKCPACDAELLFDPQTQSFHCDYCDGFYSLEVLQSQVDAGAQTEAAQDKEDLMLYSCPSCGAEVATDATTAATFCYFCHNPVILSGRLEGAMRPDQIIPFSIPKEKAVESFLSWGKKKRFAPGAFFSKRQIETITGVYFPCWVVNCEIAADLQTCAHKIRTWSTGKMQYTETKDYSIRRQGILRFEDITKMALGKANKELVEGVQPFDYSAAQPFNAAFLSGFQAEKRDLEQQQFEDETRQEAQGYAQNMLLDSIQGYNSIDPGGLQADFTGEEWRYALLPVWTVTYRRGEKLYYYALNGQTGQVCGRLPVDWKRLALLFTSVMIPLFAVLMLGGYWF